MSKPKGCEVYETVTVALLQRHYMESATVQQE